MEPTVVADPVKNTYSSLIAAAQTFTNTDKNSWSNWLGKNHIAPAYFVYDLGCNTLLSQLVLRNTRNRNYKDR